MKPASQSEAAFHERQRIYDACAVQSLARIRELTVSLEEERASRESTQRTARQNLNRAEAAITELRENLRREQEKVRQLEAELAAKSAELAAAGTRVSLLEHSLSWKLTLPVRKAADLLHWNGKA